MVRKHTPQSLFLAALGVGLILAGIFLAHLLPTRVSAMLSGIYFVVPVTVLFFSLKSMKRVDGSQLDQPSSKGVTIRYAATYSRLFSGLMIVGAIIIYANNQKISISPFSYGAAFMIATFIVFMTAAILTILSFRSKYKSLPGKEVE